MVMRIIQPQDGWSLPLHRTSSPVNHTHGGTVQKHPLPSCQWHIHRGTQERFDGANMTDEYDCRSGMPFGEVTHTGDNARLHGRYGLAAGWGTGRISLPLLVACGVVSAACENLSPAQAFPRPHRSFHKAWFEDDGHPVSIRNRLRRCDCPCERARVDSCKIEWRKGFGELHRLPLATLS